MAKKSATIKSTNDGKARLREILNECDPQKLIEFFQDMPEEDRKGYASICLEFARNRWDFYQELRLLPHRQEERDRIDQIAKAVNPKWDFVNTVCLCAGIGVTATAEARQVRGARSDGRILVANYGDFLIPVLKNRSPEKIYAILEVFCEDGHNVERDYWQRYRNLVNEHVVKPSFSDRWIRIMFNAMLYDSSEKLSASGKPITEQILADPDLLKNEVWKIFEATDFPGKWNYSDTDREHRWKDAIVELITQGKLDKDRVVDLCLKALDRTESDHRLRWFVRLLERLPLNAKEKERYFQRFLGLALHPEPTPRTFGLQYFEEGFKAGKITDSDALPYLAVVLRESSKAKAKKGLATLEKIFKRSPDLSSQILSLYIDCLGHEQGEVQQCAADFLLSHADMLDSGQKKKIGQVAESSEPSVKRSIAPLLSAKSSAAAIPDKKKPTKTATKTSLAVDVFIPEPILPIQTVEKLVDAVLKYIETKDDAEELDQITDAIARLHNERDENFERITATVRKKRRGGYGFYIIFLIECWITRRIRENGKDISYDKSDEMYKDMIRRPGYRNSDAMIYFDRIDYVLETMDRFQPLQLLSVPTHRRFLIDPLELAKRVQSISDGLNEQGMADRLLAILRLGNWNAKEAISFLKTIKAKGERKEYIDAIRYALGDEDVEIGTKTPYWVAASQVRMPDAVDPKLVKKHPEFKAFLSARPNRHMNQDDRPKKNLSNIPGTRKDYPTFYMSVVPFGEGKLEAGICLSQWPSNVRLFYHKMAEILSRRIDQKSRVGDAIYPFSIMLNHQGPIGLEGARLLSVGHLSFAAEVNGAAVDATIRSVRQDRLTADELSQACRELLEPFTTNKSLAGKLIKLNRWIKPFKTVSQESPKHAMFIRDLIEAILPGIPERDSGAFVELLYELCLATEKKISRETAGFLEQSKPSGKAAKLAKKLLEIK